MTTSHENQQDHEAGESVSVLRSLRSLLPHRALSYSESLQRAEAQATRLLDLHQITEGPVPIDIVTEQPRIRLERAYDLPVSGSAVWDGTSWLITLNAGEFDLRQRFSLLHEYKHILDHPTRHLIQGDGPLSADDMAEKVADYFAACVLMPKAWIKSAYFGGTQSVPALARQFGVSARAMSVRLQQLGLAEPVGRRAPNTHSHRSKPSRPTYFRALSTNWSNTLPTRGLAWTA
ncbi:MAG: ImmA/IrrE family metallo-endopeptidase [Ilumatobacteraceae bacterium]|nr:ImmA/IrrE family metallo-endopeptidase [Ilumatobacteraceae bacterium]